MVEPIGLTMKSTDTAFAVERVMEVLLVSQTMVRVKVSESEMLPQFSYLISS